MFKLKEFRNAHGLFQSKMAEILGTTQSSLSRMETEGLDLNIAQYEKLYDKFGKEAVDAFIIDKEQNTIITRTQVPSDNNEDLLEIIKRQNEIICEQSSQIKDMNERLFNIIEKIAIQT